jgi:CubicO group peptidase (beta-lactamase class C family)
MNRRGRALVLLVVGVSACADPDEPEATTTQAVTGAELQEIVDDWFALERPLGVIAGVMSPDGAIWLGAAGRRTFAAVPDDAMTTSTVVSYGSVTKSFTAAMTLALAERGAVSLDVPITAYGAPPDAFPAATLRDLLINRSGYYTVLGIDDAACGGWVLAIPDLYYGWVLQSCANGELQPTDDIVTYSKNEWLAYEAFGVPRPYAPNSATGCSAYAYSNSNWVMLGMVATYFEGAATYLDGLRSEFLDELELSSIYHANTRDGSAVGVPARTENGGVVEVDCRGCMGGYGGYSVSGAGGLRGTVEDLLRFFDALHGGELISPASLALMKTPGGPLPVGVLVGTYEFRYGMGTMIDPTVEDDWQSAWGYGHDGGQTGFTVIVRHVPATGHTVAVAVNTWAMEHEAMALYRDLYAAVAAP